MNSIYNSKALSIIKRTLWNSVVRTLLHSVVIFLFRNSFERKPGNETRQSSQPIITRYVIVGHDRKMTFLSYPKQFSEDIWIIHIITAILRPKKACERSAIWSCLNQFLNATNASRYMLVHKSFNIFENQNTLSSNFNCLVMISLFKLQVSQRYDN